MKLNRAERWVVNNPLRVAQQRALVRRLKKMLPLQPGKKVLEIGCGRGAGAAIISDELQPASLHAMDLDIGMIRTAGKYCSSFHRGKISFLTGDVLNLPYRDESFDAVFGFGVLHHIPDWRTSILEIARVLKAGGAYYLEEFYPSLYQNFITRHILLHPEEDRFFGPELTAVLSAAQLYLKDAIEIRRAGILGVSVKMD